MADSPARSPNIGRNTTFSDEELLTVVAAWDANGRNNKNQTAQAIGMPVSSFKRRLNAAAERGLLGFRPVLPGFRITQTSTQYDCDGNLKSESIKQRRDASDEQFSVPDGHVVKGVSALVDGDGRIISQWLKTRDGDLDPEFIAERCRVAFTDFYKTAPPTPAPLHTDADFLNFIPCNDWHVNLLTWWREVGESWDLKIAERVIGEAIATVIASARRAKTAVVLGGGDLMHNDDNTNRTARSGNILDADGRHTKGMEVTLRLMVRTVDTALRYNDEVVVRILQGNHDEMSAVAIAYFLYAWYANEPRVKVDLDQSLFWFYQHGKVMLAATHGHTVKLSQLPGIMAARRAEMWGATQFRYGHGFHVHHRAVINDEANGVFCESHQAPIPPDGWAYGSGYISGRSVQVISYHKDLGEYGRRREPIPDVRVAKPTDFLREAA